MIRLKDCFEWNGTRCTAYGIHITEQPAIIRALERVTFTNVPGRSGSLTTLEVDDVYDDFILPVKCTVPDMNRVQEISAWLRGAGALKLAARPGGFYHARISNQIELAKQELLILPYRVCESLLVHAYLPRAFSTGCIYYEVQEGGLVLEKQNFFNCFPTCIISVRNLSTALVVFLLYTGASPCV